MRGTRSKVGLVDRFSLERVAMENASESIEAQLMRASEGLLFPSETDAPFEPITWDLEALGEPSTDALRAFTGSGDDAPVTEQSLSALLGPLGEDRPDYDDDERAQAARFRSLEALFTETLTDARAYRVGSPDVTIVLFGKASDGRWVGLKTLAVET